MNVNLLVVARMNDFEHWYKEGFLPDADRRSVVCNEAKTTVAKINDHEALILMYDVDIVAMGKHMNEETMKKLEDQFGAEHELYSFSPIG